MPEFKEFRVGDLFEKKTIKGVPKNQENFAPRKDGYHIFGQNIKYQYPFKVVLDEKYLHTVEPEHPILGYTSSVGEIGMISESFYRTGDNGAFQGLYSKNKEITKRQMLYLLTALRKQFDFMGYGTGMSNVLDLSIKIPLTQDGEPDWQYMEDYVKKIEADYVKKIEAYLQTLGYSDVESVRLTETDREVLYRHANAEFAEFEIGSLFDVIKRGKRIKSADRINGKLPFVTAGEGKMGISAYIGNTEAERFSSNSLTIDMFGTTRYRGYIFGADDHVTVLNSSNNEFSKQVLQYMQPNIEKAIAGKFSYSKNFYASDAPHIKISLPIEHNLINLKLMEDYIKVIEKKTVSDLVKELDQRLKAFKEVTK
ncbi:restriction endonuclease subunit S [Weissella minor]|uniref:restriction endonuclease subunit S n=1 Tax=Weissella minor TaxID=1620 RepID=UPI001BB0AAB0|nr:restriction endonuclease subunit S [Weissella minor]MBS0950235.1 restriction endonuclease subunit S [Weissella minor]